MCLIGADDFINLHSSIYLSDKAPNGWRLTITTFFALTTRGLEAVVQQELEAIDDVYVQSQAYRRIHGVVDAHPYVLTTLHTADDVFLELATWDGIRHTRDMLPDFTSLSATLDLQSTVNTIEMVREIPESVEFSVTANFVGKRNYNYTEIKLAVADGILTSYPAWTYTDNDQDATLNIRIFIEHEQAIVGVRLAASPLHRRVYKQQSLAGSLKASIAGSMIYLAQLHKHQILVDPFCGSGTIVIEAAQQGLDAIGGDTHQEALHISLHNANDSHNTPDFIQWQAQSLPFIDNSVDAIVSNLPWGKQIQVDASLERLYQQAFAEMKRVITLEGVLVLLTTLPELIPDEPSQSFEISVFGQNPHLMIFR